MHRYILPLLIACNSSQATPPAPPPPRNFVCERLAVVNEKATCKPELSGVGDLSTHTARVTIDKDTLACALNAGQVSMVCAPLIYQAPKPDVTHETAADAKPSDQDVTNNTTGDARSAGRPARERSMAPARARP